jgi:predicted choloylglycine hydrolase
MMVIPDMRLFTFQGSHSEIGLAIGKAFRHQIQKTLSDNVELQKTFLSFHRTAEGERLYQKLIQLHNSRFPQYLSELKGISEGAEVPLEELFLVNLRGEYRSYVKASSNSGCSTCSVLTPDNAVFGHNEDGSPIYNDQLYLMRVEITGKPAFTALCYPGFLPGNSCGFNQEGICFSVNSLQPTRVAIGAGRHFIARSLFEAKNLDEAIQRVTIHGRASGFNYTIGSMRERRMVDVEVSPTNHKVFEIKGCFFHANHYIKLQKVDQLIAPSSRARQNRGDELLAEGVVQNKTGVLKVLRDLQVRDYPILRDGKPPDKSVTLITALFDLDSKRLTLYPGGKEKTNQSLEPLIEIPMGE